LRRLKHLEIDHQTISSRALRTADNPLFAINLLDFLIRHGSANHNKVSVEELLKERYFPSRIELPKRWREYYAKTVVTRVIPNGRKHALKYAA